MLLRSSEDETIHRVAAGAIANLAMNGSLMRVLHSVYFLYYCYFLWVLFSLIFSLFKHNFLSVLSETNQELIMTQGGIGLLSMTAVNAEDPQTLRMVAGAIANLCGNGKLLTEVHLN